MLKTTWMRLTKQALNTRFPSTCITIKHDPYDSGMQGKEGPAADRCRQATKTKSALQQEMLARKVLSPEFPMTHPYRWTKYCAKKTRRRVQIDVLLQSALGAVAKSSAAVYASKRPSRF